MCGIYCGLRTSPESVERLNDCAYEDINVNLKKRGPDLNGCFCTDKVYLNGFVLWQQGESPRSQPIEIDNVVLLFNGDLFNIDSFPVSDSEWLAEKLSQCENDEKILEIFRSIQGPFSFILYRKTDDCIYFGRDYLGRNSLLIELQNQVFVISSVSNSANAKAVELQPVGIFKIDLNDFSKHTVFPWKELIPEHKDYLLTYEKNLGVTISIKDTINPDWMHYKLYKEVKYNFYDICSPLINSTTPERVFEDLCQINELTEVLTNLKNFLKKSVKSRVENTPRFCQNCLNSKENCHHSKVAILFSGGVDSSILALLAHDLANLEDSIDLLNVAFEHPTNKNVDWNVPDRNTARIAYKYLLELCPSRKWNFVEINVDRQELVATLQTKIKHLVHPLKSILDESIGAAFWFAARGLGVCEGKEYRSPSRVVIVGSGADELFGGYTRHRNAYLRYDGNIEEKINNVDKELKFDMDRLPMRNLGRDDRVIGDHGRTSRAPFVEENLVNYISNLKSSQKCCFLLEAGVGDKLLLRLLAYRLGLKDISFFKKKAIQFGSRIAHSKNKATDTSALLND